MIAIAPRFHSSRRFACRMAALAFAILGIGFGATSISRGEDKLQYNRDIRPILFDTCFACHGPDSAARKADLRLDQHDAAVNAGAIVPGKPDESEMIRRILSTDPKEMMPPPVTKKALTSEQKEKLARWVKEGAEYQLHWSFIAPKRPELPAVKNEAWGHNPIDRFILAKLEAAGLDPAAEADRPTLIRRLSLDLTGLPPAPELVEAFVNDKAPNAYETLVDKLLQSTAWGEHRGRYWLDYARYADTNGIHFDNFREMWTYRDWVINSFNRNMPYNEFTIENLAGDLLPNRTQDQAIGSGFNRCNITTNEGGIIDEEYLVLYTRDRTETTSRVWLGLTANCAVCHNHKFDPLSQREFYEMAAFFNNTTVAARDGNTKDAPPILTLPVPADQPRWDELDKLAAVIQTQLDARKKEARPDFEKWLTTANPAAIAAVGPRDNLHFIAPLDKGEQNATKIEIDGQERTVPIAASAKWQPGPIAPSQAIEVQGAAFELPEVGEFEGNQPFSCTAWVKVNANDGYGAICSRMDNAAGFRGWDFWVQQRQVGMHIINGWPDTALKVVGTNKIAANQWVHAAVTYDGSGKAAGLNVYYNGKPQKTNVESDKLSGTTLTKVPFKIGQRNTSDPLSAAGIQDLRIYKRALAPSEVETLALRVKLSTILTKEVAKRTDVEKNELYDWWLAAIDPSFQKLMTEIHPLQHEQNLIKSRGTVAHVMHERTEPASAFILNRGEYDQRRDQVSAATPAVLPPFPSDAPRNRLGFAKWLLLPDNPLTARVTVNRFWQEVFGEGIVRTAGDFGVAGELPSHPELLDWLGIEFRESGWDVKKLFKLIVMSAAYRQAATTTPLKLEKDPQNRLYSRGARFRMDAEMVRDAALASCGLLVPKIGGPSVKPYQPPGVWEAIAMDVSNTRSYQRDTGESLYRRTMYTFWKRQAPPAALDIFNAPNREFCVVRRERTNTPLQALVTLNDETYIEAARHLAERAIKEGGSTFESRVKYISMRLVAREFRPEEIAVVRASLDQLAAFYNANVPEADKVITVGESKRDPALAPAELAAWTMLCNELMNLDEVLNKP